jgi:lipopolysaccharide transport system permease protein
MPRRWLAALWYFCRQDLTQRFTGNALGTGWALIAPILQLALFAFVFGLIFKARVPGLDGLGYVAFLSLGMWPWFAFAEGVARGAGALTEQVGLLSKVAVSPAVLVCARVLTAFGLHGIGFLLVVAVLAALSTPVSLWWLPLALPGWIALLILAMAAALVLSITQVFVRDLQQIVAYGLVALMFLSPILYPAEMLPATMAWWGEINPIAGIVQSIRLPLLYAQWPGVEALLPIVTGSVLLLLAGLFYRRMRRSVIDFL